METDEILVEILKKSHAQAMAGETLSHEEVIKRIRHEYNITD